jgi:hypothetical protein
MMKQKLGRWRRNIAVIGMTGALVSLMQAGCDDGCVFAVSLQPFYSKAELESDTRLTGIWSDKEGDVSFTFEQSTAKDDKLVVMEKEGGKETFGEFEAHLVQLGGSWFLDFFPKSIQEGDQFFRIHFLRGHSITRVEIGERSMHIAFFSAGWLKARIEEKSIDTPHEKADGSLLLTGTTEEVQELVFLHADDEGAFSDPLTLERQEVEEKEQ